MRGMPFFKPKKGVQFAGQNFSDGDGGGGGSYVLPTATADRLGGVKVGSGVTVQEDGTISVSEYELPTASASTLGGVKIGDRLSINAETGVLSAADQTVDYHNAGYHNSIYRGQSLGTEVTEAQYNSIQSGSFDGMFIGDYWTIGGVNYRIAAFDYWLHTGDTECTDHHVLLVPDSCIGENQTMNDTATTAGGYVGSKMYTTNLASAKSTITSAFGSGNILSHRELLSNTVDSSGNASSWSWYDSDIELMNEQMIYGGPCGSKPETGSINFNMGIDKSQLPLFAYEPSRISIRVHWWLRSVVSSDYFALVFANGDADYTNASYSNGVRPAFAIYKPTI